MSDWLDSEKWHGLCERYRLGSVSTPEMALAIREHFEPKRKWIKITDDPATLPKQEPVLVTFIDRLGRKQVEPAYYDYIHGAWEPNFQAQDIDFKDVQVLAWMPLPEPWGEE